MDDGKPTGPKATWWSRPSTGHGTASGADGTEVRAAADAPPAPGHAPTAPQHEPEPAPVAAPAEPGPVTAPAGSGSVTPLAEDDRPEPATAPRRPVPLHDPDPYSTPPYGDPGPWAPAPPVQRPAPVTPAHGTPVPTPAQGTQVPAQPTAPGAGPPQPEPRGPGPAPAHHAPPQPPHQTHPGPQQPLPQQPLPQQPLPQHPADPGPVFAERPQPLNSVWLQYDPWSAPGVPLSETGEPAPRKRRRGALLAGAVVLALVAGGVGGAVGAYVERNGGLTSLELPQAGVESADRAPESVAGIAASALPSVVTLHVSGGGEQGTGTGFVLDKRGHILTNHHVVDPAGASGDITVTFSGGETAEATLVGKDSGYDLAVVKVSGVSGLKPLPLGNSDNVRVGDPVVAIGAPFDLQNTVTSGIISATERPITAGGEKGDGSDVSYVDALQTDAPINPGNSGGPLVDGKARVIGINSAIRAADSGAGPDGGQAGSIGLGFAIPINQGKRVAEELINTGRATHPVIGVSLDMKFTGDGARVGEKGKDGTPSVTPGGPAASAGVRPGDVITAVNGQRVHSGEELIVKIRAHRPGDRLELTLTRGAAERTVEVTLGTADSS